jgi:pilus assembly protein CpaF
MSTDRIDTTAGPDPSDLPLFATLPAQRPGRVRGSFSMNPAPPRSWPRSAQRHGHVNGHAGLVARPLPRPFAGELDWPLVAALRQQASDRLSAALGEDRTRT